MGKELWRDVVGYRRVYRVSSRGQIEKQSVPGARRVVQWPGRGGYRRVMLSGSGRRAAHNVHRLVLGAFVGPCPGGMQCAHLDGDPANNNLENLAWVTPAENCKQRDDHGTTARGARHGMTRQENKAKVTGSRNGNSRLTDRQVLEIRQLAVFGTAHASLAKRFGVREPAVWKIVNRRSWNHL